MTVLAERTAFVVLTFGGPGRNVLFITADDAIRAAVLDATGS